MIAKPGIAAGVAVSGFAGMCLATGGLPGAAKAALCLTCIVAAACGSAVVNVLLERRTDALMQRTAWRDGAVAEVGAAGAAAASLALVSSSFMLSWFFINRLSALLVMAASFSYIVLYTVLFKRRSPYGTVPGGIPGALPVLIGYTAVKGAIGFDGVILFLIMLLWQPPHFLALALKYKGQYEAAGIPVMPAALGERYSKLFIFIYAAALPPLSLMLSVFGGGSAFFAYYSLALGALFIASYYRDIVKLKKYGRAFGVSIVYILALMLGVIFDAGFTAGK